MPRSRNRGKKYNSNNGMSNQNSPIKQGNQKQSVQVSHTSIKGEIFHSKPLMELK